MPDTNRPSRPTRRFSALRPPAGRDKAEPGEVQAAPAPAPVPVEPPAPNVPVEPLAPKGGEDARIAKVMARAGLCSRRDAEAWIAEGRVAVNGTVLTSPALNVGATDAVTVDGYPIDKPERTRLFLFNKTRGLVTTARDPEGRQTIFDVLPAELPRLVTVGRLDINTEGLLLLTNDGGLARLLELPATGWIRRYRVRVNGTVELARLEALAKGLTIDGVVYAGIAAKLDRVQGANAWLTMGLKEGKNREIKRVLEHLGLAVTRLIRVSFGPFQLGELADGAVEEVRTRVLRDQLGSALAKAAGVDFDGPLAEPAAAPAPARPVPAPESEPRRQTRRSQTADRRGRAVTVERISTAKEARRGGETPAARPGPRPRPRGAKDETRGAEAGRSRRPSSDGREGVRQWTTRGDEPARPARPGGVPNRRPGPPGERSARPGPGGSRSGGARSDGPRSAKPGKGQGGRPGGTGGSGGRGGKTRPRG